MVRVGTGRTAFWIDRYEASVWEKADGTGKQYGVAADDYPMFFPKNGKSLKPYVYTLSKAGVKPSANITWFQANEVCRLSGKRLPATSEWLAAARGTEEPAATSTGADGHCVVNVSIASGPQITGNRTGCQSDWGAQDMAGNLFEFLDGWQIGVGQGPTNPRANVWPDPALYGNDATWNIASGATSGGQGSQQAIGIPSAMSMGGDWYHQNLSGVFAIDLSSGVSSWDPTLGFRCVIPR